MLESVLGKAQVKHLHHDHDRAIEAGDQLHKLSCAVEPSPNAVLIADPDSTVKYVNSHVDDLTGVNGEDYMGGDSFTWHRDASTPRHARREI